MNITRTHSRMTWRALGQRKIRDAVVFCNVAMSYIIRLLKYVLHIS